jgi:hypothetical protein
MQTLTVTRVVLTPTPSGNTVCTVYYSVDSDPTNWQLIDNNVSVPPDGNLTTALVVNTIPDSETGVNVRAVANCGGTPFDEHFNGTTTTTTTAATTTTTTAATTTTTTTAATTTTTTAATTTTTTTLNEKVVTLRNNTPDNIIVDVTVDGSTSSPALQPGQSTGVTLANRNSCGINIRESDGTTTKVSHITLDTSEGPDVVYQDLGNSGGFTVFMTGWDLTQINFIHLDPVAGAHNLIVTKANNADEVNVAVTDTASGFTYNYPVHSGSGSTTFVGAIIPGHTYNVTLTTTPTARALNLVNSAGTLQSSSSATTITATGVLGNDGNLTASVG